MKKAISILFVLCILVCSLAGCSKKGGVELVDISDSVQHTTQDGQMILTGFDGEHKNIFIPDSVNGTGVTMLSPSFANEKAIETVKLPDQINAFIRQDDGLFLCMSSFPNSVGLNKGNAAAVFCEFFNVDFITVNGVAYSKPISSGQQDPDLSGEWKNTDIINGIRYTQVYTFNNGKVTCVDSEVLEGTYEIKDGKLLITMDDVTAEFEFVGDQLICWEHGIRLSTKSAEDYAETSDTGWSYIVTPSGYAQLVGYHGSEANVTVPYVIDGYEVSSINSCVADTYNFTNLNYKGDTGTKFAGEFNNLYYDTLSDNYILYGWKNTDGNRCFPLDTSSFGSGWDIKAEVFCRFFKQAKITIDGREYSSNTYSGIPENDVVGCWRPTPQAGYGEMLLSIYGNGVAELHFFESDSVTEECSKCRFGNYTIVDHRIIVAFDDGSLTLEYFDTICVSLGTNELLSAISSEPENLEFTKGLVEDPFVHVSAATLKGRYSTSFDNYVDFKSDGTAVVTMNHTEWRDSVVQYSFENDVLTLTDGITTEQMTLGKGKLHLEDSCGNYYDRENG